MRLTDISPTNPAHCVTCDMTIRNPITAAHHRAHEHMVTDATTGERIVRMIRFMKAVHPPYTAQPRELYR